MIDILTAPKIIIPGDWNKALEGYDQLPYEETEADAEFIKSVGIEVQGLGRVNLETTRVENSIHPKTGPETMLVFDGQSEIVVPLADRNRLEQQAGVALYRITRWHPRYLIDEAERRFSLAIRFPSGRIVQQLPNNWVDLSDNSTIYEIMAHDREYAMGKLDITYLSLTTPAR